MMREDFIVRDIIDHNKTVKWNEWQCYKGKVYDINKVINVFSPILEDFRARRYKAEKERDERREEKREIHIKQLKLNHPEYTEDELDLYSYDFSDDEDEYDPILKIRVYGNSRLENKSTWANQQFVLTLRKQGLEMNIIKYRIELCCIGLLDKTNGKRTRDDIKKDVQLVLEDLMQADLRNELTTAQNDYMQLLSRWMRQYGYDVLADSNFVNSQSTGDINQKEFPIPEEILANISKSLRPWLETCEPFDTSIPPEGAWCTNTADPTSPVSDMSSQDLFISSLRRFSKGSLLSLDMELDGKTAWAVIPQHVFRDDVLTDYQVEVESIRRQRTDLDNRERMKRRREKLLNYFMKEHQLCLDNVEHFSSWANNMENGEKTFQELCI